MWQTEEDSQASRQSEPAARPGLIVVWSGHAPVLEAFEITGDGVVLGRELLERLGDDRISRLPGQVRAADGGLVVADLGSRNGTYVGGKRIDGEVWVQTPAVIRTGRTISVLVDDVRRFLGARVERAGDAVIGPTCADAWQR